MTKINGVECGSCPIIKPRRVVERLYSGPIITCFHPLSPARVRDGMENALNLLTRAWDEKIRRFRRVLHESETAVKLLPMPL